MDGLWDQECLGIKIDCTIRHVLGKCGDQREMQPLEKNDPYLQGAQGSLGLASCME